MSRVTGVTLLTRLEDAVIAELNAWLDENGFGQLVEVSDHYGGPKVPPTKVYGGGFNYLPDWHFIELVMSRAWALPDSVVLVMSSDDGESTVHMIWTHKPVDINLSAP